MNKRSGIESKKRIIDAALKLFSEYGYSKASMRMIANASGISVGGLYLYFKNKDELYLTLIKSRLDELVDMTRKSLKDIDDPADAVSKFISLHLAYAKNIENLYLFREGNMDSHSVSAQKENFLRRREDLLRAL